MYGQVLVTGTEEEFNNLYGEFVHEYPMWDGQTQTHEFFMTGPFQPSV